MSTIQQCNDLHWRTVQCNDLHSTLQNAHCIVLHCKNVSIAVLTDKMRDTAMGKINCSANTLQSALGVKATLILQCAMFSIIVASLENAPSVRGTLICNVQCLT